MVGYGCAIGWLSMALPLLKSDNSPLSTGALSVNDVSWIGSSVSLGALTGNFIFGFIVTKIGARHAIFIIGFPQLVSIVLKFKKPTTIAVLNLIFEYILGELAAYDVWNVSIPFDTF